MNNKLILLTFMLPFASCGQKEEKRSEASEPAVVEQSANGEKKEETLENLSDFGLTQGLPSFCEELALKDDQSCYRCTISDTPIDRCVESAKPLDFAKDCNFDQNTFACKDGEEIIHKLSLTSPMELQILNFVPIAVLTARAFVGLKLKDKPDAKTVVNNSLDFISTHIRKFVLLENKAELKTAMLEFAAVQHGVLNKTDEGEPEELSEAVKLDVSNGTDALLDFLQRKRLSGQLNIFDGLELAKELTKAIPSLKLEGPLALLDFKSLDITAILSEILSEKSGEVTETTD